MIEIVSPAGSPEGVIAAVQNGADAIYLGYKEHNSNINATNFTQRELNRAIEYCRIRGVRTYLTLNTLAFNNDFPAITEYAKVACRLGIDAIIVSDFGVMRAVRKAVPEIPIHADLRMSIHNLEGVKVAAAMGFKRVILTSELSLSKLKYICKNSPIETEILVHGEMCVSYTDQCYLSSIQHKGSNSRGRCAQLCRNIYNAVGYSESYPLSIKDNCLAGHIDEISNTGITAIRISGRSKRPEYTAIITGIYAKALHSGKVPNREDINVINKYLTRYGLTDGYFSDKFDPAMFGVSKEKEKQDSVIFTTARKNYLNGEYQRVPIRFVGTISKGKRVKLGGADDDNNSAVVYGPMPAPAFHRELNEAALRTQLHKTSGTPFYCAGVKGNVEPGLSLPIESFSELRNQVIAEIIDQRKLRPVREEGEYVLPAFQHGYDEPKILSVQLMRLSQLSSELIELEPNFIYIPISKIDFESPLIMAMMDSKKITPAITLPHIIHDSEKKNISDMLRSAAQNGINDVLLGNLGQIHMARTNGMTVRGDYSLNAYNSESVYVLRDLGFKSITLPYELGFSELKQISKPIDTELIVYGRLPLMLTENCIVKNSTGACTCDSYPCLVNKDGAQFPIMSEFGCRNIMYSPRKLYMADKQKSVRSLGVWARRLNFTTENAIECVAVLKRFMGLSSHTPANFTRGLYYQGIT